MSVITSEVASGRRRACPICGAPNSTCGTPTTTEGVPRRRREHRRRSGKMMRIEVRGADGRPTLVQVPVFAADPKDDDGDQDVDTKKTTAPNKKRSPDDPKPASGRPVPKIRTK